MPTSDRWNQGGSAPNAAVAVARQNAVAIKNVNRGIMRQAWTSATSGTIY
jgi:hypothetical protein